MFEVFLKNFRPAIRVNIDCHGGDIFGGMANTKNYSYKN